jgi:hypothetical protein
MSSAQGHLPVRRAAKAGENATIYQIVTTKDTFLDSDTGFQVSFRMIQGTTITALNYSQIRANSFTFKADIDSKTTITTINPLGIIERLDLTNATMINLTLTDAVGQVVAERHLGVYHGGAEGQPGAAAETFSLNVTPLVVAFDPSDNDKITSGSVHFSVIHTVGQELSILTAEEMTKYNCRVALLLDGFGTAEVDSNIAINGFDIYPHHVRSTDDEDADGYDVYAYMGFTLRLYVNDANLGDTRVQMLGDGDKVFTYSSDFVVTQSKFNSSITTRVDGIATTVTELGQDSDRIWMYVMGNDGKGGIEILSEGVTLYGDKVQIKSSHGSNIASFQMIGDDGCINTAIINADKIVAKQVQCIRKLPSNLNFAACSLISTINRSGDGAFETFHPTQKIVMVNGSMSYEDVPAMRIVLEKISIDGTEYTALIQVFNTSGQLVWALTTIGIINVDLSSASFRPVSLVSGLTESEAYSTLDYTEDAKTYYRVSSNDDNNGRFVTQECTKKQISSYLVKSTTLYEPKPTSLQGINTDGSTTTYYRRNYYTIDSEGNVKSDSYVIEERTNPLLSSSSSKT